MAFSETLRLILDVDAAQGTQGFDRMGRSVDQVGSRLDQVGGTMTRVGAGMLTLGTLATLGMFRASQAASDLNEAANKSAEVFGDASGKVAEFAKSAADIGLSERAALSAAGAFGNMFDQLGFATDQAADMSIEMVKLAADFASFHNLDPSEVLEAMEAGFRGEFDALQRLVPTINAAAVQQRAMADTGKENAQALTEAEKAAATYALIIEGAGAAQGDFSRTSDSAANRQRQFNATLENTLATLGQAFLPLLEKGLGLATGLAEGFKSLDGATGGAVGTIAAYGSVALVAAGALSTLVGQVIKARENLSLLAGVLPASLGGLAGAVGPLGLVAGSLVAIGTITARIFPGFEADIEELTADLLDFADAGQVAGELSRVAGDDLGKLGEAFKTVVDTSTVEELGHAAEAVTDLFSAGTAETGLNEAKERIDALDKSLAQLAARDPEEAAQVFDRISEALQEQGLSASDVEGQLNDYAAAVDDAEVSQRLAEGSTEDFGTAMGDQATATEEAVSALQTYADELKAMFDPLFGMVDALDAQQAAQQAVVEAQANLDAVRADSTSTAEDLTAAEQDLNDALAATGPAAVDVTSAALALTTAVQNGEVSIESATATLQSMAAQGLLTEQQLAFLTMQLVGAKQAGDSYATTYTAHVEAKGLEETIEALDRLAEKTRSIPVIGNIVGNVAKNLPRRQLGGPVRVGGAYVVGEDGPELFVPDRDGTIVPSDATANVAAARFAPSAGVVSSPVGMGAGSVTVVNEFHFHGPVAQDSVGWVAANVNKGLEQNRINNRGRRL